MKVVFIRSVVEVVEVSAATLEEARLSLNAILPPGESMADQPPAPLRSLRIIRSVWTAQP